MKLVIEIPEDVYEWLKLGYVDINDKANLVTIIKSGIPFEECEDCVSKQSVKELIRSGICTDTESDQDYVCELVDNLPICCTKAADWSVV